MPACPRACSMPSIAPAAGPQVFTIKMLSGSYDTLAQGQLLVDDKVFHNDHFKLGQLIPMGFVDTGVTNVPSRMVLVSRARPARVIHASV